MGEEACFCDIPDGGIEYDECSTVPTPTPTPQDLTARSAELAALQHELTLLKADADSLQENIDIVQAKIDALLAEGTTSTPPGGRVKREVEQVPTNCSAFLSVLQKSELPVNASNADIRSSAYYMGLLAQTNTASIICTEAEKAGLRAMKAKLDATKATTLSKAAEIDTQINEVAQQVEALNALLVAAGLTPLVPLFTPDPEGEITSTTTTASTIMTMDGQEGETSAFKQTATNSLITGEA